MFVTRSAYLKEGQTTFPDGKTKPEVGSLYMRFDGGSCVCIALYNDALAEDASKGSGLYPNQPDNLNILSFKKNASHDYAPMMLPSDGLTITKVEKLPAGSEVAIPATTHFEYHEHDEDGRAYVLYSIREPTVQGEPQELVMTHTPQTPCKDVTSDHNYTRVEINPGDDSNGNPIPNAFLQDVKTKDVWKVQVKVTFNLQDAHNIFEEEAGNCP